MSDSLSISTSIREKLQKIRDAGAFRELLTVDERTGSRIKMGGRWYVNFAGNDYLGLAAAPETARALNEGIRLYGAGTGASAVVTGHTRAHSELEELLCDITGKEAVILFNTGFAANQTLIKAGINLKANLLLDRLVHASMQDAVFSAPEFQRFRHNDMVHAKKILEKHPGSLIFTEGVFSMDGDLSDLKKLTELKKRYNSYLILDDAHGFGVLGERGCGTAEHLGISGTEIDVFMGTLSKACGLSGAFIAADRDFIDYLINTGREYIYSTAAPAFIAHALIKTIKYITGNEGRELRHHLHAMTELFRKRFSELDINASLLNSETSIQPVIIGANEELMSVSGKITDKGFLCGAIRPPTVPQGTARLRITVTAAHNDTDIINLTDTLKDIIG